MKNFTIHSPMCEYRENPIGISTPKPRFSWKMLSDICGKAQTAYRICVADSADRLCEEKLIWDSGKCESERCFGILYEGKALKPCMRYYWRVTIWDNMGECVVCAPQSFETGFFSLSEWKARWITAKPVGYDTRFFELGDWQAKTDCGAVHIRSVFNIKDKSVSAARLYSATTTGAFGNLTFCVNDVYLTLNGKKIGADAVTPGQLSEKRCRALYRAYDVTADINCGKNAVGVVILSMAYSACLSVSYADGEKEEFLLTDNCVVNGRGPYTLWDDGVEDQGGKKEDYNALREYRGYDMPDFDDSGWNKPNFTDCVTSLEEQTVTTEVTGTLKPVKITSIAWPRHRIIDFGQNINGHIRLKMRKPEKGKRISVLYAEALTESGELDTRSSVNYNRGEVGAQCDSYIPRGDEVEVFEPKFANHGFRYVLIVNCPYDITCDDVSAQIVGSPVFNNSEFECSDKDINALFNISYQSQKANLVSVPTDCPSRERHGWLGDAFLVAQSECINFNLLTFYESWLKNIADDMRGDGLVYSLSPYQSPLETRLTDTPWGTAVVMVPWYSYEAYGDERILKNSYPTIKKWIEHMQTLKGDDGIIRGGAVWNDASAPVQMNKEWLGTLYYYISLVYTIKIARTIGEDFSEYEALVLEAKNALVDGFKTDAGFADNLQSDLAHATVLSLLDNDEQLVKRLKRDIEENDYALKCGALSMWQVVAALEKYDLNDVIFRICKQRKEGSFLYWIENFDATTAFESLYYEPYLSRNHPFLMGSVTRWFFEGIAGIRKTSPGYKTFDIVPYMPDDMTYVRAKKDTNYGIISVEVTKTTDGYKYEVAVPCGTRARLFIKATEEYKELESGVYSFFQ